VIFDDAARYRHHNAEVGKLGTGLDTPCLCPFCLSYRANLPKGETIA
jgi:hypothetical protein